MRQEEGIMKKNYEKPTVEVVKFQYRDQVVAASTCTNLWTNIGDKFCHTWEYVKNFAD